MRGEWNSQVKTLLGVAAGGLVGREVLRRLRAADLHNQVALITGSSRGLGFLLAREFAREGCRIVICAREEAELRQAQEELEREGAEVLAVPCDVGDRAQVEHLVEQARRRFGQIDILVTNAGIIQVGPLPTMEVEDFENAMNVMFWGVLYPILAVLPEMRARQSGRIVSITSVGGKVSVPHLLPYNSAKFAAVGLSEGLRAELARDGITVTTIVPGLMRTGSPFNAFVSGHQELEFAWFALGDNLPFLSMDAERAARQIVRATKLGEAERILTIPANLLARFHGLFPGLTTDVLAVVNRVLPPPGGAGTRTERGTVVWERIRSPLLEVLMGWGLSAARRFQQPEAGGLPGMEMPNGNQGPGS